jgi:hypothetical protein
MNFALALIATAMLLLVVILVLQLGKTQWTLRGANGDRQRLVQEVAGLQARVQVLSPYQHIIDAQAAAAQIHAAAQHHATAIAANAQSEAARLTAQAHASLSNASAEAKRMVDAAKAEMQQTMRAAQAASEETMRLQATAAAMRNIVDGYGDRYILPTASALDDLAEEFGFAEAGAELKRVRARMREMIRRAQAASCDYFEPNRRATAIDFVIDAFNGKVDSVLADVRHDNYGTLRQKIEDAFQVVNHNGSAFRNSRIRREYLHVRLEELRWAVAAHELKVKQREEQRALKERIREEERAQREFERALKETEKEEELLKKAMEKARAESAKASDAQKAQYEAQLQELAARLRDAEEKNKRALSMAQQTKAGHVYIISNVGSFGENVFKIGLTRRLEPLDRIRELGEASVPFEFDVHALIECDDAPALERALHQKFVRHQVNKVNARKEFFRLQLGDIRAEIERLSIQVSWTMAAEARDYRETLALERALSERTIDEKAWAQKQVREHDVAVATRELAEVN